MKALLILLILFSTLTARAELPRKRLLIDFNGATIGGETAPTSGKNSDVTDPFIEEIRADQVINLPDESVVQEGAKFAGDYTPAEGFGFLEDSTIQQRYRGKWLSPLLVDEVVMMGTKPTTFRLDLPAGKYRVTTYHHDLRWKSTGNLAVEVDGKAVGSLEKASQGKPSNGSEVARISFEATVAAGKPLDITFVLSSDAESSRPSFPINGIYVEPLP
jgi:hypothetical protein